jgi:chromosome segregation ATPase
VHSFRQIRQKIRTRIAALFRFRSAISPEPPETESEVMAATGESRMLAAERQGIRTESERVTLEVNRILAILDEDRQEAKTGRADLQRRVVALEAEHQHWLERFKSIETSLADTLSRLDTVDDQVRVFHDRSREREKEFGASLSLVVSRLDTTDSRLEELRHTSLQQVTAIESSLADTTQQVTAIESSLADASTRMETMDGRIRAQEQKLDLEHQLYLHTVQEIQSQVRNQDQRLSWTMMAAVFAMLLGSVAGGILIWDVQKNARILGGISMEVKQLGSAMAQSRLMRDPPAAAESARLPDFSHAGERDDTGDRRVVE